MSKLANVIAVALLASILVSMAMVPTAGAQQSLQRQVDSLFVIASSGEVMYRDKVEPAKESLVALGGDAVPFLIEKLTTKSARERVTLEDLFKKIGRPAVPHLLRALKREDPLIVQRVCSSLGDIGDSSAVQPLMEVCADTSWQVRDQAIGALGRIGDAVAAGQIGAALADTIGQVRKSAAVATGRMKLMQYCAVLVHLLGDDFYGARMCARHALLQFDTMIVIAAIADSLESPNRLIGDLGCKILGDLGTDPAIELLLQQTRSEEPERRAHAAVALIQADPLDNCNYRRLFVATETDRLTRLKIESAITAAAHEQ